MAFRQSRNESSMPRTPKQYPKREAAQTEERKGASPEYRSIYRVLCVFNRAMFKSLIPTRKSEILKILKTHLLNINIMMIIKNKCLFNNSYYSIK